MSSTQSAMLNAQSYLMPMLEGDDVSVDIRIGRSVYMAFVKADPVAMATFLTRADDDFRARFFDVARKYMPDEFYKASNGHDQG